MKLTLKSFPGHEGRPGQRGGSVPREGSSAALGDPLAPANSPETTKANNAKRRKILDGDVTFTWDQINSVLSKHASPSRILGIMSAMVVRRKSSLRYSDVKTGILRGYPFNDLAKMELGSKLLRGLVDFVE